MNEKKHILIVDDDPDCLFQLSLLLSNQDIHVSTLDSQQAAEEWLSEHKPHLAVFDLMMERDDSGFVLSRFAKKIYPDMPVVILTAVTPETGLSFDIESEENRKWIKADLYLEKGVNREQISKRLLKLLD